MPKTQFLLFTLLLLVLTGNTLAASYSETGNTGRTSIYLGVQDYYWDERDDPGSLIGGSEQLLEENGLLFELGVTFDNEDARKAGMIYNIDTRVTTGTVDYDGQTQAGDPASTDVDYLSWDLEGNFGYRFAAASSTFLDLQGGIGYDYWRRELKPTTISSGPNAGTPVSGLTEHYKLLYVRLSGGLFIPGQSWDNHLRIGLRGPLYIEETIDELPGLTLEPKMQPSPFAEWQLVYRDNTERSKYGLSVYYEETRFDRSDAVAYGGGYVWQPESFRREAGIRGHIYF
ncbi:MAG: hypothetical protein R3312_10345 [Gammaproteobacteria bacterium]|nr:hypothetical protein [Gammaproteobacteria bacterium]